MYFGHCYSGFIAWVQLFGVRREIMKLKCYHDPTGQILPFSSMLSALLWTVHLDFCFLEHFGTNNAFLTVAIFALLNQILEYIYGDL